MTRWLVWLVLFAGSALAGEREVGRYKLVVDPAQPPVEVMVSRMASSDGGVMVRLTSKGKPPFVVYQGGGDEDGAGDKDVHAVQAQPFALAGGRQALRVDVTYHAPDRPKKEEQTDTTLIALSPGPHAVAELRTRLGRDRSKTCREVQETALALDGDDLVATTSLKLDPALGDDDLPIDKTCRSPAGASKKIYKWSGEQFVDESAPAAKTGAKPNEDNDD